MNPKLVDSFREYIAGSISCLSKSLTETLQHEALHYDSLYKEFVKIIDAFKMDILNQIKPQLFPEYLVTANKGQEAKVLLSRLQGLVNSQKVENPERKSVENNDYALLKPIKNTEPLTRPLREIESNLLLSNIDISNKDLLAQKAKQKDDSQGNTIRDSILRPGPRLSAYRSDDCVLSKQNTLSNGSGEKLRFSLDKLASGETPEKLDPKTKAIENTEPYNSSSSFSSTLREQIDNESQLQTSQTRSKTDSFFRVFGAPCSNAVKLNFGERYRQTFLGKQSNESNSENPNKEIVQTEKTIIPSTTHKEAEQLSHAHESYKSTTSLESKPKADSAIQVEQRSLNNELLKRKELARQKLRAIFMTRYFQKWRHLIAVFHIEKYNDTDFDLLHGNIEGIEDIIDLDMSIRMGGDPRLSRRGILTPLKIKDPIISSEYDNENLLSGRLSFCDINFPETDRSSFDKILFPDQKTLLQLGNEKQSKVTKNTIPIGARSPNAHKSPRKPLASRQHLTLNHEKENIKNVNKDKNAYPSKAHLSGSHKKENQKPEYIRVAARTSLQKSPAGPVKTVAPARGGSLVSNKENAFTGKTSPVRPVRKFSGNYKL